MSSRTPATDAKQFEQQLASLNQKLEANISALEEAQALTHLGSWQWDVATGEIAWSDEMYRIYGFEPQERQIGFKEFIGLIHPQDQERIQGAIGAAFQSGKSFEFEHRIIMPDEQTRILQGKGKSDKNEAGEVIRMLGTSQDITERYEFEQALKLSDERFKAVAVATNDVVYDLNLQSHEMWFNETLNSEYGYSTHDKHQTWWSEHIHPDDRDKINRALTSLLEGESVTWWQDYRLRKDSGDYVTVRDRAYIIRDEASIPVRMIGSILDITQQKEFQPTVTNSVDAIEA